jgi:hypothetical protein
MGRRYALVIGTVAALSLSAAALTTTAMSSAATVTATGMSRSAAITTRTAMSLSAARVTYGREEAERVSVAVSASRTPAGRVTVAEGPAVICTITLAGGKGACAIGASRFAAGRVKLTADYQGGSGFARSVSPAKTFTVARAASKTTLELSAANVTYGDEQSEQFSVRVSPAFTGTPQGRVTVKAGSVLVCVVPLKSGEAICSLSANELSGGTDHVTAAYTGSPDFVSSSSAGATLTVASPPCSHTAAPFCWPTAVSANGRYLLDQDGHPYLIVGDSPHSLFVNLTEAEANEYFADRQAHGFDAAWIEILCDGYTGGNANGATYDGIVPFTTPGDFATPNPAYFERVDDMLNLAAEHGITVFLDPADTGGWMSEIENNGPRNDFNYGVYLGNRYKNFPNIIWISGDDFQSWQNPTDDADVSAIAKGIASVDHDHLQTVELNYEVSSSLDDAATWGPIIKLNLAYTYYPTYAEVLHAYNQTPTIPAFLGEANYEFEDNNGVNPPSSYVLRLQEYWTMTSGATGQIYGNHYTWDDGTNWADEQANLDTVGVQQLQYLTALFDSLPWQNLVPDQSHTFVTAGYGTFSTTSPLAENNYVTAAIDPAGTTGVAYLPQAGTVTVNMAKMSGPVTARWYDPTSGLYTAIGTFSNSGTQQFTSPGPHRSDGYDDWVLLLQS